MKILTFGFDGDVGGNPHAPHNAAKGSVVYTGTHDNNTIRGWFEHEVSDGLRDSIFRYIGGPVNADQVHRIIVRLAMLSAADTVIIPMQDILGLGGEARMNRPGTTEGNWEWRLRPEQAGEESMREFAEVTGLYGRR
jgi:4-alpha-glucanotransferase